MENAHRTQTNVHYIQYTLANVHHTQYTLVNVHHTLANVHRTQYTLANVHRTQYTLVNVRRTPCREEKNTYSLRVTDKQSLNIKVHIENKGEDAHEATYFTVLPKGISYVGLDSSGSGKVSVFMGFKWGLSGGSKRIRERMPMRPPISLCYPREYPTWG